MAGVVNSSQKNPQFSVTNKTAELYVKLAIYLVAFIL